jgi:hypothetical protein
LPHETIARIKAALPQVNVEIEPLPGPDAPQAHGIGQKGQDSLMKQ